ncbi:MAG: hypothetical protein A3F17_02000 [Gammaproteobacteria bacterium RIFCSPHIGHO2_12_FULL_41_15]|nr:MAG: hypothetical protein A3F17_02000 [Gammaproteobacteria bacterium RIFCSPHIGHO2_12_FULL_41_15]
MIKKKFFPSRLATQTFAFLLFGFVLIQAAGLFIFNTYFTLSAGRASIAEVSAEVVRFTTLVKVVGIQDLPTIIRTLPKRGLKVSIASSPLENAQLLFATEPELLRTMVRDNPDQLSLSMPLADSRWLNISIYRAEHPWLFSGFIASIVVLTIAILMLCLWAVQRLAMPVEQLGVAAKRFGKDMNAPPMPTDGPIEVRELGEAFNEMQARLKRLITDRTQMLAAISHDLRTPITRLKLRAENIKDKVQYKKTVEDLNVMDQMIGSILAFARDYDQEEPMEKFDLNALVETLIAELIDLGYDVKSHLSIERLPFFGRLLPLKRAISNLIENSIKYGKNTEVSLSVTDAQVVIKIADEGPGIPENEKEKVFSPFYRVDPARSPDIVGTGLGLSVARDIIRSHGGEIVLKNKKPCGLVALVTLPLESE